jgi:hypothetical protein
VDFFYRSAQKGIHWKEAAIAARREFAGFLK